MNVSIKSILSIVAIFIIVFIMTPAVFAAPPTDKTVNKPSAPSAEPYGLDVSYPQCGKRLPKDMAFAIVGVNGGIATTTNDCLVEQLLWGSKARGGTSQPLLQLYVNTANPAGLDTISWPVGNIDPKGVEIASTYGVCEGKFNYDLACSYQYGWNRAAEDDILRFVPAATQAKIDNNPANYVWWLDVEIENTWSSNYAGNVAVLEGMADYFKSIGANVGIYSNSYQWGLITNNLVSEDSSLRALPDWRPSGTLDIAIDNCDAALPLTPGGYTALTQYVLKNLDHNYSCNG